MWSRLTSEDARIITYHLGGLIIGIGLTMVIPLVIALLSQEKEPAADFFLCASGSILLGSIMRFALVRGSVGINSRQAIIVTGFIWIMASLLGAVPLFLSGHFLSFTDALFDSISGFTDTGVALIQNVNHLSISHNIWRVLLHLIGGMGIIVIALGLGVFTHRAGAGSLYSAEGNTEHILPDLGSTARFIALVTAGFIAFGTLALLVVGLTIGLDPLRSLFHAFMITVAGFETGGFAPTSQSIMYYHSFAYELVAMAIMLSGTFSFALYAFMIRVGPREFLRDIEVRTIFLWVGMTILIMAFSLARDPVFSQASTVLRRGVFTIVSAATNTGFNIFTSTQLTGMAARGVLFAAILAMAMGGATTSTTGGIKALRVGLIFKSVMSDIKEALLPEHAQTVTRFRHLGSQFASKELISGTLTVFLLYIFAYLLGALVAIAYGYPPLESLFESVSVVSNAGLSTGIATHDMPLLLKYVYMFGMLAGRLEFIAFFSVFAAVIISIRRSRSERVKKAKDARVTRRRE